MEIVITDKDIELAESLFLSKGQSFDEKRRNFIKCIDSSLHLQACPGSGKTTTLLAKLYILSEKMPFENNKGICVLTHTNVAIDIIKNKLGDKANRLLSYPNFFGTIQSFVDKYLAIPAYIKCFGYKPNFIDVELQREKMLKTHFLRGFSKKALNNLKSFECANNIFGYYTFKKEENDFKIVFSNTKKEINIKKPSSRNNWSENEIIEVKKAAIKLKIKVIKDDRIISYDDAFDFAKYYLEKFPELKNLFSSRFKFVFIDEAQDTSAIQKEIIEKCFKENVIIQWIGDVNQGIMNDNISEPAWQPKEDERYRLISLTKSHRISQPVANLIKNVAVNTYESLNGNNEIKIKPILIVFHEDTINLVLNKFAELVVNIKCNFNNEEKTIWEISNLTGNPIKAVGWVGREKQNGLSIKSYFLNFEKKLTSIKRLYFPNLYTMFKLSKHVSPKEFKERTLNCIIEALYISDIKSTKQRRFSKTELLNEIKQKNQEECNNLFCVIAKNYKSDNFFEFLNEISEILESLEYKLNQNSKNYLCEQRFENSNFSEQINDFNFFEKDINGKKIKIEIDTVHGVKGETHTATLYLETKFYQNSIKYLKNESSDRRNKALKIMHVAFSRPTHLLCISLHRNDLNEFKQRFNDNNIFEVMDLNGNTDSVDS
ncbi:MAG: UvrD-helicase domain-containing protein [Candidatus Omnitrophica bacterium]|nr:UvrD-helicase domain-containing protein [Candidatus Omnitrophota bacterium]